MARRKRVREESRSEVGTFDMAFLGFSSIGIELCNETVDVICKIKEHRKEDDIFIVARGGGLGFLGCFSGWWVFVRCLHDKLGVIINSFNNLIYYYCYYCYYYFCIFWVEFILDGTQLEEAVPQCSCKSIE